MVAALLVGLAAMGAEGDGAPAPGEPAAPPEGENPGAYAPPGESRGSALPVAPEGDSAPGESVDAPPRANVQAYPVAFEPPGPYRMVIGEMKVYAAKPGETFLDIGRREDLGIGELEEANPKVDPWLPNLAPWVIVPSAFVVPPSGRRGIVINVPEMRMYYFPGPSEEVLTFPLGLGPYNWQTPRGWFKVARKEVNPVWRVPPSIQREMENPIASVPAGPDNPLGKYRFVLSIPGYGIHGTNRPWGVGRYYSHGCIRMYPEDIHWLFDRVPKGFPVEILYAPVKVGLDGFEVFLEVHRDPYNLTPSLETEAWRLIREQGVEYRVDAERVRRTAEEARGFPVNITRALGEEAASGGPEGPRSEPRKVETPAG